MLSGDPVEINIDDNTDEVIVFDEDVGALIEAVFDVGSGPGVEEAADVDGGGGDEVVPEWK